MPWQQGQSKSVSALASGLLAAGRLVTHFAQALAMDTDTGDTASLTEAQAFHTLHVAQILVVWTLCYC